LEKEILSIFIAFCSFRFASFLLGLRGGGDSIPPKSQIFFSDIKKYKPSSKFSKPSTHQPEKKTINPTQISQMIISNKNVIFLLDFSIIE
jgi:hypothetical protein